MPGKITLYFKIYRQYSSQIQDASTRTCLKRCYFLFKEVNFWEEKAKYFLLQDDNPLDAAKAYHSLGCVKKEIGFYQEAIIDMQKAIRIVKKYKNQEATQILFRYQKKLGDFLLFTRNYEMALQVLRVGHDEIIERAGSKDEELIDIKHMIAQALMWLNRYSEASNYLDEAWKLSKEIDVRTIHWSWLDKEMYLPKQETELPNSEN